MTKEAKSFIANIKFKKNESLYVYWWGWKHDAYKIATYWSVKVTSEDYKETLEKIANKPGFDHFIDEKELDDRNIVSLN